MTEGHAAAANKTNFSFTSTRLLRILRQRIGSALSGLVPLWLLIGQNSLRGYGQLKKRLHFLQLGFSLQDVKALRVCNTLRWSLKEMKSILVRSSTVVLGDTLLN